MTLEIKDLKYMTNQLPRIKTLRSQGDFVKADELRNVLNEMGVNLSYRKDGHIIWRVRIKENGLVDYKMGIA